MRRMERDSPTGMKCVVDLLRDDPEMGPKTLQDSLKKKYSMDVPYYRVVRGKLSALDMIYGK